MSTVDDHLKGIGVASSVDRRLDVSVRDNIGEGVRPSRGRCIIDIADTHQILRQLTTTHGRPIVALCRSRSRRRDDRTEILP
jgi:hypothetical protein